MQDETVQSGRVNLDRERPVGGTVPGTWGDDVAPRRAATEHARHGTGFEHHGAASPCIPLLLLRLVSSRGSRWTQSRRSAGSTSVRRPRLTARNAPDFIAS